MLVPGLNYNFETLVECISEMGVADQIRWAARVMCHVSRVMCHVSRVMYHVLTLVTMFRVLVSRKERNQPILTACINMPVPEMV